VRTPPGDRSGRLVIPTVPAREAIVALIVVSLVVSPGAGTARRDERRAGWHRVPDRQLIREMRIPNVPGSGA
jgi:hypothetical protein